MNWISVKDRLPEVKKTGFGYESELVLTMTCDVLYLASYEKRPEGMIWWNPELGTISPPTHWCEIPELPKQE